MQVADVDGKRVDGAVFVFTRVDDPDHKQTVGQNDFGNYDQAFEVDGESEWNLSKSVTPGYLPAAVRVESLAADGQTVQTIESMELNPGIPVPPVKFVSGGAVRIDLTLGDQQVVMQAFLAARTQAREQQQAAAERAGAYATALRLYGAGQLEESLPHFAEAAAQDPDNLEIQVTRANVLYKAKKFEEFESAARRALELDPANGELWMMLYSSSRDRGDLQAALDALLAVKGLGASGADLKQHLDFVAAMMGTTEKAIPAWEAVLELDEDDVAACVALASIHATAGRDGQAQRYLDRAVELDPADAAGVYFNLGSRLLEPAEPDEEAVARAVELLQKSVELSPSFAPAHKKLGLALWKASDLLGARRELEKYLELDPQAADKDRIEGYLASLPTE